ncbi:MAG: MerR family transcriptional regulator [Pseudomonadota bacterium]|nr:MerR family transcriptional regulator [Pseudomonadota bacterium]
MKPIREAARLSGLSEKTIRYYEDMGLVTAARNPANGYREFSDCHIADLRFLHQAREMGFDLAACQQLLQLKNDPCRRSCDVKAMLQQHIDEIAQRVEQLQALQATLQQLADQCRGDDTSECAIIDGIASAECEHLAVSRKS